MFILTLDKITWILFNRKNQRKSLQSLLKQGFQGISNKLPNKNSACLQNLQTKALLQDQTTYLSSVHRTDEMIKTKTAYTSYLSSVLPHVVRYGFKLTLFAGEARGAELRHASP